MSLQTKAADTEDAIGKSPVTPGYVLSIRELLGDMYAQSGLNAEAMQAFNTTLEHWPNRRRSLEALKEMFPL